MNLCQTKEGQFLCCFGSCLREILELAATISLGFELYEVLVFHLLLLSVTLVSYPYLCSFYDWDSAAVKLMQIFFNHLERSHFLHRFHLSFPEPF